MSLDIFLLLRCRKYPLSYCDLFYLVCSILETVYCISILALYLLSSLCWLDLGNTYVHMVSILISQCQSANLLDSFLVVRISRFTAGAYCDFEESATAVSYCHRFDNEPSINQFTAENTWLTLHPVHSTVTTLPSFHTRPLGIARSINLIAGM